MSLKRKRSRSNFSPSSTCSASSRDSASPSPFRAQWATYGNNTASSHISYGGVLPGTWATSIMQPNEITSSQLHSRTRKRFRDNRPSESIIHENTYSKLFQAQKLESWNVVPSLPRPAPPSQTSSTEKQAQSSLHRFWNLPTRNAMVPQGAMQQVDSSLKCDDCDTCLDTEADTMDIDVDPAAYTCHDCKRAVCDRCAVVVPGEGRECLQCKTNRKKWVGGIGWLPTGYL